MLLSLLALATLTHPLAENWVKIGSTPDGVVVYLDLDSTKRSGDTVSAVTRHDYSAVGNPKYRELRVTTIYDCRAKTAQVRQANVTNTGGEVEYFTWEADESPVDPAGAGTISETALTKACGKG